MNKANITTYALSPSYGLTQLVSKATRDSIFLYIGIAGAVVAVFGFICNAINLVVFYLIGFEKPCNICYFSLAFCDIVTVCWVFIASLINIPFYDEGEAHFTMRDIAFIFGTVCASCSSIGSWATAIISLERCCCVIFPMKVKFMFTRKTVTCLLMGMVVFQVATATPFFYSFNFTLNTDPVTNWTRLEVDRPNINTELAVMSKFLSYSLPTFICLLAIVIGTTFLIIAFNQSTKKRVAMTGNASNLAKDSKVVKTVIIICTIYIIGFFPNVTLVMVMFAYPTLHLFNPYLGHLTSILIFISYFIQVTSCSVNIFVYFKMNQVYRAKCETFLQCFWKFENSKQLKRTPYSEVPGPCKQPLSLRVNNERAGLG